MINNKGQALVEFVLILPVFIFLLFAIYDFGMIFNTKNTLERQVESCMIEAMREFLYENIFNTKNTLENNSIDVIDLYKSGKSIEEIKALYNDISIEILDEDNYKKVVLKDKVKLITPGLNKIFGNPYTVDVVRYIGNEQNEQ